MDIVGIEMESKEINPKNDNEVPHSESEHTPMILIGQSSPVTPPSQQLPSSDQPAGMSVRYLAAW